MKDTWKKRNNITVCSMQLNTRRITDEIIFYSYSSNTIFNDDK